MMARLIRWLVNKYLDDALVEAYCRGFAGGYKVASEDEWEDIKIGGTDD